MLENYLLKGLVIGVVFGVPAGVVGILSIQRVLTQGAFAGFLTGIGSSAADIFYACVGVFGLTFISDILLKHQSTICIPAQLCRCIGGHIIVLIQWLSWINKG